jgi:hypothetical protein
MTRAAACRTPFHRRVLGAALLDAKIYEEVEADRSAGGQATLVVLLMALGGGIGSFENAGFAGIAVSTVAALVGWVAWAWITYWIGTRILPTADTVADHGELLRAHRACSPCSESFRDSIPGSTSRSVSGC